MTASTKRHSPLRLLNILGSRTLRGLQFASKVATYCAYATYRLIPGILGMKRVSFDVFVRQTLFTGVEALPFTAFIALLVGGSLVLSASIGLGSADGGPLGRLLAIALVRELAPLITGLIIIGRSGTAVVVELGNMRVSGEVDTLESMGIDVFEYLVIPRMGAFALSTFCNAVLFTAVALIAGVIGGLVILDQDSSSIDLSVAVLQALTPVDLVLLILKTLPVGLVVSAVVCLEGLQAGPSITDVPRAATRGTVKGFSLLFVMSGILSALSVIIQ